MTTSSAAGTAAPPHTRPDGLLRAVGVFLLAYAVAVGRVGTRARVSRPAVGAVVVLNVLWAVGSLVVVLTGAGTPSTAGAVWLVLQAAVVAAFGAVQVVGLRRS